MFGVRITASVVTSSRLTFCCFTLQEVRLPLGTAFKGDIGGRCHRQWQLLLGCQPPPNYLLGIGGETGTALVLKDSVQKFIQSRACCYCSLEDDKALECALAEHWEADSRYVAVWNAASQASIGFCYMQFDWVGLRQSGQGSSQATPKNQGGH